MRQEVNNVRNYVRSVFHETGKPTPGTQTLKNYGVPGRPQEKGKRGDRQKGVRNAATPLRNDYEKQNFQKQQITILTFNYFKRN